MAKNSVAQSDEASSTSSSSSTDDLIKDTDNKNVDKKQKKTDISLNKKKSNKKIPVVEQKIGKGLEFAFLVPQKLDKTQPQPFCADVYFAMMTLSATPRP